MFSTHRFGGRRALACAALCLNACSSEGTTSPALSQSNEAQIVGTQTGVPGVATFVGERRMSDFADAAAQTKLEAPRPLAGPLAVLQRNAGDLALAPAQPVARALEPELTPLALRAPRVPSPPPAVAFKATDTSGTPPDTMGAVGPKHVVTIINFRVIVQDRSGATLSSVDLAAFFGSVIPNGNAAFDPRAVYDNLSNRFVLSAPSGVNFTGNSTILLAVSQTSDPTGAWRFYAIPADPSGLRWADHPGLAYNSKWLAIQANMVPLDGTGADTRQHFWAINKASLYAGAQSVPFTFLTGDGWQSTPAVTYDASEPNLYLLETQCGTCGGSTGTLRLRRITGAVGSETLQDFAPLSPPAWGSPFVVPQQGSSTGIDFTADWIQNVVFRNGSVWASHQVGLPASAPTHVGVRWYEIRPTSLAVAQAGTLEDTTGVRHFGLPSIAVNSNGDALVGYSRSASNQFVSADYAARAASDPPSTLRDDTVFHAGGAAYDAGRWGDYSNTVVDPVDGLTFWTIQEAAEAPTSSYSLWWAKVPAPGAATGCSASTATDLGPRTTLISVPSNACVKVSQYPSWWQFTNGLVTLQSGGSGTFPVPATWTDSCTSLTGSVTFTTTWQSAPIGNHTASCPVVIQLKGSGAPLQLNWF